MIVRNLRKYFIIYDVLAVVNEVRMIHFGKGI